MRNSADPLAQTADYYQKVRHGISLGSTSCSCSCRNNATRGQDGAGMNHQAGRQPRQKYISRKRSIASNYLEDMFQQIHRHFERPAKEKLNDPTWLKENKALHGRTAPQYLRYGTHSDNSIETCHPSCGRTTGSPEPHPTGNFNLTNVDELFDELVDWYQYPKEKSDTVTVLKRFTTSSTTRSSASTPGTSPTAIPTWRSTT